jgi:hypothetical protein
VEHPGCVPVSLADQRRLRRGAGVRRAGLSQKAEPGADAGPAVPRSGAALSSYGSTQQRTQPSDP